MTALMGRRDIASSFPSVRRRSQFLCAPANDSGLRELDVERDGYLLADQDAAGLQRSVPGQSEVFAVNLRGRRQPYAGVAPGIFGGRSRSLYSEHPVASNAANGQVSRDGQLSIRGALHAGGLEGQGRKLLHMEEVGAFQMRVALGVAGVDRCPVDRGLDTRVSQGFLVEH